MRWLFAAAIVLAMSEAGSAFGATCDATVQGRSGSRVLPVVELYTSEGCDSCPPADRWFSSLSMEKHGVVPLAFHVDYWDYIGWKDKFARADFAARQRDVVRRRGGRTVYTPQVMLNGQDLRATSNASLETAARASSARVATVELGLEAKVGNGRLEVDLRAASLQGTIPPTAKLFLAVTESNLSSRVTAGENKGATLRHDHVVREFIGPLVVPALPLRRGVALKPDWNRDQLTLVAFVEDTATGEVLQALHLPLCRS
ncbi:MAG: DUF1223 domain-containing protein [Betaproteobacteria bacterium]|nr:DUF1223 domain-containing protein [Betaproteobacteria bacterium]